MKLITEREKIRGVAAEWRRQYGPGEPYSRDKDKQEIQRKLDALDPEKATGDDVERIIGNRTWTAVGECDECKRLTTALVELGDEPDYESSTAQICQECLLKALRLITPPSTGDVK